MIFNYFFDNNNLLVDRVKEEKDSTVYSTNY